MGQLNNQYVSSSFQGLLKMTNSTTGVTNTLQTVQTGDGTDTPLQISQTQVNISGSLTVNGASITGSTIDTGSFATTGSNTFIGSQIIEGNLSFPSNSFVSTDNVSGALYFSSLNQGTLYINADGGEGNVNVGHNGWTGKLNVTGSLGVTNIQGTGSLFLQPNQSDARYLEVYNTSPTDTHITASGGQIFLGDDQTYVKVDNYGSVERIDVVAGNELVVSSSVINLTGSLYQSGTFYPDVIDWFSSSIVQNTGSYVLTTNASGVTQYDSYANIALALDPYISGATGSSGTSGTSGSSGQAGSSGTSGNGTSGTSGSSGVSNSFFNYQAKTVSFGAPGSGYITWNQSPQTGATFINVSDQDTQNDNVDIFLANLGSGSVITLQDKTNHTNYQVWELGTSVDNTTYWTFPVTLVSATHQFSGNDNILFIITTTPSGTSGTAGTSGTSGQNGSSGTSGADGSSGTSGGTGTSGTSGSSGTGGGDRNGLITTGSITTTQAITGSLILGNTVISGSLIGNVDNSGIIKIQSQLHSSSSLAIPFGYISSSNPDLQTNIMFGTLSALSGSGLLTSTLTGSIVISGSNNILLGAGNRGNTITQGTYGYLGGGNNIGTTIPTLNTGSLLRPSISNNALQSSLALQFTTSSLSAPSISSNLIYGSIAINHQSGSLSYSNNLNLGGITSTANTHTLPFLTTIQQNYFGGTSLFLNHFSSSITATNNIIGGAAFSLTNLVSSSVSTNANGLTFGNNLVIGSANGVWVSGSNPTNRRTVVSNIIGGQSTAVSSSQIGTESHLVSSIVYGQNLIVSASHASGVGGSTFVGRYNATGSLQESSQDAVFVVGTGTGVGSRRNALHIDNNNNTRITGSVTISGSLTLNGSPVVGSDRNGLITTGSLSPNSQSITGSLEVSGSINNLKIHTGSVNVNSIGIGTHTLASSTGSSLNNVAIGDGALRYNVVGANSVAIGNSALQNSTEGFNLAIGGSSLTALLTGESNIAIGSSAVQALTGGTKNTAIGFNSMVNVVTGSANVAIGSGTLQRNTSGSNCVVIGNQAGSWSTTSNEFFVGNDNYGNATTERSSSMFYGQFNTTTANQTLQINASTDIRNNLKVTGSLQVSGSLTIANRIDVDVLTTATASLNLALGSYFAILDDSSPIGFNIEASNLTEGQMVTVIIDTTSNAQTITNGTNVSLYNPQAGTPTTSTGISVCNGIVYNGTLQLTYNRRN